MKGLAWRKIYGTIAGWAIFVFLTCTYATVSSTLMDGTSFESSFTWACVSLVFIIASAIVSVIFARKLNRKMIAETEKNQEVIRRYLNGEYEDVIPEKMKTEAGRQCILDLLTSGRATSVKGAVVMAKKKKVDRAVGGVLIGITALLIKAGDNICEDVARDMAEAIAGPVADLTDGISSGSIFGGSGGSPAVSDNTWERTKAANKAVFMETQAKNAAMAAPGSYGAKRADNLAKQQRYKANHM